MNSRRKSSWYRASSAVDWKGAIYLAVLLGLLAAVAFLLPLYLNRDVPRPDANTTQALFSQTPELASKLMLALEQERANTLDQARATYLAVAQSTFPLQREAALQGLARVDAKKATPRWMLASRVNEAVAVVLRIVTVLVAALLAGWLLLRLVSFVPRRSGFMIGEFVVQGAASPEESSSVALRFRQGIADSISLIQLVHTNFAADLSLLSEPVIIPSFGLPGANRDELAAALAGVVELQVTGAGGLSLEKLLNLGAVLRDRRRYAISGSLTLEQGKLRAIAKMMDLRTGWLVNQWEVSETELPRNPHPTKDSQAKESKAASSRHKVDLPKPPSDKKGWNMECTTQVAQVLAYRILFDLLQTRSTNLEAKSWLSFYYLTESLRAMKQYTAASEDPEMRKYAVDCLWQIIHEIDHTQKLARFNLGLLYLNEGKATAAKEEFDALVDVMEAVPPLSLQQIMKDVRDPIAHWSLSLWYFRQQCKEQLEEDEVWHRGGWLFSAARNVKSLQEKVRTLQEATKTDSTSQQSIAESVRKQIEYLDAFPETARLLDDLKSLEPAACEKVVNELAEMLDENKFTALYNELQRLKRWPESIRERFDWGEILRLRETLPFKRLDNAVVLLAGGWELGKRREFKLALKGLEQLTHPIDEQEGNRLLQEAIKNTRLPFTIRLLATKYDAEFLRIQRWMDSLKTEFYAQVLYHRARALFQTFEFDNLVESSLEAERLVTMLDRLAQQDLKQSWNDRLRALSVCLQVQSTVLLFLIKDSTSVRDYICPSVTPQQMNQWSFRMDWWSREEKGAQIRDVLLISDDKDPDIRASAFETLGLWARYQREQDWRADIAPEIYFQLALALRTWANTRVYLAESIHKKDPEEAKRLIALALAQAPQHALALRLQKELDEMALQPQPAAQ